jgi:hypothetical protein
MIDFIKLSIFSFKVACDLSKSPKYFRLKHCRIRELFDFSARLFFSHLKLQFLGLLLKYGLLLLPQFQGFFLLLVLAEDYFDRLQIV